MAMTATDDQAPCDRLGAPPSTPYLLSLCAILFKHVEDESIKTGNCLAHRASLAGVRLRISAATDPGTSLLFKCRLPALSGGR
jgi:hypothetical protein